MSAYKSKILYYAGWNSFTHIGGAYILAKFMPEVEFHVASAEKWPFEPLDNLKFYKLIRPNCAMRIDEKFFLHTYPYEKELGDLEKYRKHLMGYLNLVAKVHPNLIISDITLEIAIWSKFLGYPVALFYETIDSNNMRHQLAWNNVDSILVRYPKSFIEKIEPNIPSKMFFAGGVSKFDTIEKLPSRKENFNATGAKDNGKKIITILSCSHSHNTPQVKKYFETICEGANDLGDKYQIFMLYPQKDRLVARLKQKYRNINFVVGVHNTVHHYLAISDLVITSAGMGATMESAFFRVPMLVIPAPWILNEQLIKSVALENLGAAIMLNPVEMTSADVKNKIDHMINDQALLEKIKESERQLIDKKGYKRLASHLRKMLRSSNCHTATSVIRD